MHRVLIHQEKAINHEDVSFQTQYPQIQITNCVIDEQDIHCWGNPFRKFEAEIQPLIHFIISTLQGLHEYQEE